MLKEKMVVGLVLSIFVFPFLEVAAADYEYDWLQRAQLRTFQNKRLQEKQEKEKIEKEKALKKEREAAQKIREEKEKMEKEALEEARQVRKAKILKEAETEKKYYELLKERAKKRNKEALEMKQKERFEKQNWTKLLNQEKNADYLKKRTSYSTRKIKSGYLFMPKKEKKSTEGFVESYMNKKSSANNAKRRTESPNTFRGFYRRMAY